jgi:uncharacterized membrane protein YqjE
MSESGSGLMGSLRQLISTLTAIVSTRLELLANELQEERLRLTQMLFFSLCTLFLFSIGIVLLVAFIVVLFWDEHRLAVLGFMSVLFLALGAVTALMLRNQSLTRSKLFDTSLAELVKDREQLNPSQNKAESL